MPFDPPCGPASVVMMKKITHITIATDDGESLRYEGELVATEAFSPAPVWRLHPANSGWNTEVLGRSVRLTRLVDGWRLRVAYNDPGASPYQEWSEERPVDSAKEWAIRAARRHINAAPPLIVADDIRPGAMFDAPGSCGHALVYAVKRDYSAMWIGLVSTFTGVTYLHANDRAEPAIASYLNKNGYKRSCVE